MTNINPVITILGSGTMGAGIAQVAATNQCCVNLLDTDPEAIKNAQICISDNLNRAVSHEQLTQIQADDTLQRINFSPTHDDLKKTDLLIEAVVEDLKLKAFAISSLLPYLSENCIIATNTSSLSIEDLALNLSEMTRTIGLHFFNPPTIQPLVELVHLKTSSQKVIDKAISILTIWGKTIVLSKDSPGFIVNRIARPFYLEAWRILDEGIAQITTIDRAMRELGGFPMGPFELIDFLGHDLNYAVSQSLYKQLNKPDRFKPPQRQKELIAANKLGRKTNMGAYDYSTDPPTPVLVAHKIGFDPTPQTQEVSMHIVSSTIANNPDMFGPEYYTYARILVSMINEAKRVFDEGVASMADINTAMKLGTRHPHGPFEYADMIGTLPKPQHAPPVS